MEWARLRGERGLALTIPLAEKSLEVASRARDEETVAVAKGNLAYYYAEEDLVEKKELAIVYARYAKDSFPKFSKRYNLLSNSIYARMKFADRCQLEILDPLRREAEDYMRRFPSISTELGEYVEEMKRKCPALE